MEKGRISDLGNELVITIDLPGLNKEDINVKYGEDFVEVTASKKAEVVKENKNIYLSQKVYKRFYRKINLPNKIVPEKSNFNIIEGILQIITPKKM